MYENELSFGVLRWTSINCENNHEISLIPYFLVAAVSAGAGSSAISNRVFPITPAVAFLATILVIVKTFIVPILSVAITVLTVGLFK